MSTFAALGLIEPLCLTLASLGYETPTAVQVGAIPGVLAGRDVLAAAQTGTGKTAAFVLPLVQRLHNSGASTPSNAVRVLVLVPTRELAEQVCSSCRDCGAALNVESFAAYGGVSINPQMMRLRRGVDVLVATPGRLLDLHRRNAVTFQHVEALVFDEADRMLDLGFSEEISHILSALPTKPQMLLFSATFSETILALAARLLDKPVQLEASPPNRTAQQVEQWLVPCDKKKKPALFMHLLKAHAWSQVLVFVKTRQGADELASLLQEQAIAAEAIHGDRTQASRLAALASFKRGEVQILVATDVAARGLDIELLPQVVNFDLPHVAEDYVHRIGRTGRAGASGVAISLVCADEVGQLAAIETLIGQTLRREEVPGFEAEHRVPQTAPGGQVVKKPKKPKSKKEQRKALLMQSMPGKTSAAPAPAKPGNGRRSRGKV